MDLAEVSKFETKVGVIKLSEAIRRGIRLSPQQCRCVLYDDGASCALGAAALGRGWIPGDNWAHKNVPCDTFLGDVPRSLFCEIGAMNDRGVPREEIADILEARGL